METIAVDAVVVGGGIIGLTVALEFKDRHPNAEVVVLEREHYFGDQSTGRNSGVLHAGIYYKYESLKHRLCLEGYDRWMELSEKLGIRKLICGKFIFSTQPDQQDDLDALLARAVKNGVTIRKATKSEKDGIAQHVNVADALYSPRTGILDAGDAVKRIVAVLEQRGVHLLRDFYLTNLEQVSSGDYVISSLEYKVQSPVLFNCAGLGSLDLRKRLGLTDLGFFPVKGNYISTSQKLNYKHLYYPVPPRDLKGLGVHSTIDLNGGVKFGPNTEDVAGIDYSPSPTALKEMTPLIHSYFKDIDESRLYWDYAGIRSKIKTADGSIHVDFWIKQTLPGYVECLGIESPGLTSAPAIAAYAVSLL